MYNDKVIHAYAINTVLIYRVYEELFRPLTFIYI